MTKQSQSDKLSSICMAAVKRRFAPEFVNRIDVFATYHPLDRRSLEQILEQQLVQLQLHLDRRLMERSFTLVIPKSTREFLLNKGTSTEYGARELKRVIHRYVMQPIAAMVSDGRISPDADVIVDIDSTRSKVNLRVHPRAA